MAQLDLLSLDLMEGFNFSSQVTSLEPYSIQQLPDHGKDSRETAPNLCQTLWLAWALQTDGPRFSHSPFPHLRFVRETKAFVYGYKRQ